MEVLPDAVAVGPGDGGIEQRVWAQVASGDLNCDGVPDFVIGSRSLNVLLSQPDGGYSGSVLGRYGGGSGGDGWNNLWVQDLDGDGWPDIIVAGALFYNSGDGGFVFGASVTGGIVGDFHFAVGDVNGDGLPDIVVGGSGQAPGSWLVQLFLNLGSRTFGPPITISTTEGLSGVGDVNGDGRADVILGEGNGLAILLSLPDGGFEAAPVPQILAEGPVGLLPRGTDRPDLVVQPAGGRVLILHDAGGGYADAGSFSVPNWAYMSMVIGDFNGDCVPDIALAVPSDYAYHASDTYLLLSTADGGMAGEDLGDDSDFSPLAVVGPPSRPTGLAVGNFVLPLVPANQ